VLDQFTQLVKKSVQVYLNDQITGRLKTALKTEQEETAVIDQPVIPAVADPNKIETTAEELEAFQIIRSIVRKCCPVNKVHYRDAQSYFAILFDDNNRKPICRMYLNGGKKYIALFDVQKNEVKKELQGLDDIFLYADELCETVTGYKEVKVEA
jgi:hypothetical protein